MGRSENKKEYEEEGKRKIVKWQMMNENNNKEYDRLSC